MARRKKTNRTLAADHPGRKNLRPAKPGEVRNPTGKNGSEWLKAFRDFFEEVPTERMPKGAPARAAGDNRHLIVIRALFRNMVRGSEGSLKLGLEQLQGRARQHIEVSGMAGNGPAVTFMLPPNGRDVEPAPADAAAPVAPVDDGAAPVGPEDAEDAVE